MVKKTKEVEHAPSLLICERRDDGEDLESLELSCTPFVQVDDEVEDKTPVKKKG